MKERNSSYQYSPIQDINTSISNTTTTTTNSSTYISTILKFISHYQTFLVFLIGILLGFYFHFIIHNFSFFWFQLQSSYKHEMVSTVMHISDTHIDYFFNPNQSSLTKGVCHSCDLVWTCPKLPNNLTEYETRLRQHGYAFGRYGCNPPHLLFQSLIHQMKEIDPNPNVIIFTGFYLIVKILLFS